MSAFDLPLIKKDGALLNTERGNAFIQAINRLANMTVRTVRTAGMIKSGLQIADENAVLMLAYRDAANVLGTAATVDIVTPYSGKRALGTQNGRNGSGGTIVIDTDGTTTIIPPTRSGGIGTRKSSVSAKVKVGGVQKNITSIYRKTSGGGGGGTGSGWVLLASLETCVDVTAEYQSKTGTYTLCGKEEFVTPSIPPRKFRTLTVGGSLVICNYGNWGVTPACQLGPHPSLNGQYTNQYSGAISYNASTCAVTDTTQKLQDNANVYCGDAPSLTNVGHVTTSVESVTSGTALNKTENQTTRFQTSDFSCVEGGILHAPYPERVTTCSSYDELTNEDTEADAIARANALLGWDSPAKTVALNETRGAGDFSASYVYVEWRAEVTGLMATYVYSAKARYGRRAYGTSDPFDFFAEGSVSFTATGGTEYTPWEAIPNESGYETNILSARVCLGA